MRRGYTGCVLLLVLGVAWGWSAGAVRAQEQEAPAVAAAKEPRDEVETDLRQRMRRGLKTFGAAVGRVEQHEMPSGPRTDLSGDRLEVSKRRFSSDRVEKGLELSLSDLAGNGHATEMWQLNVSRRQYYRVRSDYGLFWSVGVGLTRLTDLVPEQSTHTNFDQYLGLGAIWARGQRGAWTGECRFFHVSNGKRQDPNVGLNCSTWLVGWSVFF